MAEPSTEWLWILSDVIVNTYWFFWFLLIFQIPCTITSAWPTWCLLMSNKCSPALLFSSTTYCYIRTWILAPGFMLLSFILLSTYVLVTNKHFYCRYMEFSVHSCSSFPSAISEYLMLHTNRRRRDLPEVSTPPIITWPLLTTPMYYFHSNLMRVLCLLSSGSASARTYWPTKSSLIPYYMNEGITDLVPHSVFSVTCSFSPGITPALHFLLPIHYAQRRQISYW